MTVRPIVPEHRVLVSAAVAVLVAAMLIAAGCVSQGSDNPDQPLSTAEMQAAKNLSTNQARDADSITTPITTADTGNMMNVNNPGVENQTREDSTHKIMNFFNETNETRAKKYKEIQEEMKIFAQYQNNLTTGQKKLDPQILELIDPAYPHFGIYPVTTDVIKKQMISSEKNLIPVERASQELGISQPKGDLVWVTITTNSGVSAAGLNSYLVNVTSRGGNIVNAWIYLDDVQTIASLDSVRAINLHVLPVTRDSA